MQRSKINDYCEFPEEIDFRPWTKEGIREREKQQRGGQGGDDDVDVEMSGDDDDNEGDEEEAVAKKDAISEEVESGEDVIMDADEEDESNNKNGFEDLIDNDTIEDEDKVAKNNNDRQGNANSLSMQDR